MSISAWVRIKQSVKIFVTVNLRFPILENFKLAYSVPKSIFAKAIFLMGFHNDEVIIKKFLDFLEIVMI